jgi:hypothetical protein
MVAFIREWKSVCTPDLQGNIYHEFAIPNEDDLEHVDIH